VINACFYQSDYKYCNASYENYADFSLLNTGQEYRLSPAYDLMNTSLHLVQPRIFALDKGLFREGIKLTNTQTVCKGDFEGSKKRYKQSTDYRRSMLLE
jgi:hypothetical protein